MGPGQTIEACQAIVRTTSIAPLPLLYDNYQEWNPGVTAAPLYEDFGVRCMAIAIRPAGKPQLWKATATFRKLSNGEAPADDVANPLLLPIKYWIEFSDMYETIKYGAPTIPLGPAGARQAGAFGPIVNGALKPFPDEIQDIRRRAYYVAEKPFATLQEILDLNATFDGTENDGTWYGYTAGHARFAGVTSTRKLTLNDIDYYLGTIRVEVSGNRFEKQVDNVGYEYFEALGINLVKTTGADPVKMDDTGVILADNSDVEQITYRLLEPEDYTGLGI
jgi:hypothetical protein